MLLDSDGVPYTLGAYVWPHGYGVQLDDFTPPTTFDLPESINARVGDAESGATAHYGNRLSHHAQQLITLMYLSENSGFDDVVWCLTKFDSGDRVMALNVIDNSWCEIGRM